MPLRIRCKCGKILAVPDALIGKKVACPGCKKAYRAAAPVPAARPQPKESPSELELSSIDPTASPSELNLLEGIDLQPSGPTCPRCKRVQPADARICVACGIDLLTGTSILDGHKIEPVELGYAGKGGSLARGNVGRDAIAGPTRGYWADAFLSFIYPLRSLGNTLTFALLLFVVALRAFLYTLAIPGFFGAAIISGWFAALYFSVVQETASGSADLPGIKMEDGFVDDIIKPSFKYLGAIACAMLPAAVYLILLAFNVLPPAMESNLIASLWLAAGIFVWPFFVMLFAFDALNMIFRVDLLITTIFRTFLPYCALWLMLLLVGFGSVLSWVGIVFVAAGFNLRMPEFSFGHGLVASIAQDMVGLYLTLVAMRQIGLYYLHYKKRFTFLFE